jgi:cytochrome c-type biogenesis protein CcmH
VRSGWWPIGAAAVVAAGLATATLLGPLVGPPSLQDEVLAIARDVRCPECEGESAATSNAAASLAIRAEIAKDLQAGETKSEILDHLAAEYGTWILYRPPARGGFVALWAAPALAVPLAAWGLWRLVRPGSGASPRPPEPSDGPPEPGVEERLARFL